MPAPSFLVCALALHPVVRQTLRGLDARCAGLSPCATCAEAVRAMTELADAGLLAAATPNVQSKAMRMCEDDLPTVERIFASLPGLELCMGRLAVALEPVRWARRARQSPCVGRG